MSAQEVALSPAGVCLVVLALVAIWFASKRLWVDLGWTVGMALAVAASVVFGFSLSIATIGILGVHAAWSAYQRKWRLVGSNVPLMMIIGSNVVTGQPLVEFLLLAVGVVGLIVSLQRERAAKLPPDDPERWFNSRGG